MTTSHENPDGTRTWKISPDAAHAVALLEGMEDPPELTREEFDELAEDMRLAREEADAERTGES